MNQKISCETVNLPAGGCYVFQGDSITDFFRDRNPTSDGSRSLGDGYPLLVSSEMLRLHPEKRLRFFNRGISGNTVADLLARWQEDTLDLRPDVLSILIGVNDYWHMKQGTYDGTVIEFEANYEKLLLSTHHVLPNVQIIILEPFLWNYGVVKPDWIAEFAERRAIVATLAKRSNMTFVPLQQKFDELLSSAPAEYWTFDGVHPTVAGNAAIAEALLHVINAGD